MYYPKRCYKRYKNYLAYIQSVIFARVTYKRITKNYKSLHFAKLNYKGLQSTVYILSFFLSRKKI